MKNKHTNTLVDDLDLDQMELKGFARSIAEIEWLLLLIVLLYYMSPEADIASPAA